MTLDFTGMFEKVAFMGFRGTKGFTGASLADDAAKTIKKVNKSPSSFNYDEPVVRHIPVKRRPTPTIESTIENSQARLASFGIRGTKNQAHFDRRTNQVATALQNRIQSLVNQNQRITRDRFIAANTKGIERGISRAGLDPFSGPGKYYRDIGVQNALEGLKR